jgi:lysophospholipase L1-like esterase
MTRRGLLLAALVAVCTPAVHEPARGGPLDPPKCQSPVEIVRFSRQLVKFSARVRRNEKITIVAIGSSSTFGTGASAAERAYPSQLERELRASLPKVEVTVLNRGIGGEDARQMLSRLDRELVGKPDLVLWQVGTNALLGETGVDAQAPLIRDGLHRIRATGADAVLIDPQYAPHVLRDPDARPMVALIAKIGAEAGVPVFRRFALMQHWHEAQEFAFTEFLASDQFHMNDWSYACLARNLAAALLANARASTENGVAASADAGRAEPASAQAATGIRHVAPVAAGSH